MRLLFLLTQDLESPSGLGRYLPLARELTKLGHEVTIAALHANYDALANRRLNVDGVEVCYVAPMHVIKQGSDKQYYGSWALAGVVIRAGWALSRLAWRTPADIIFVAKPHPMNSVAGLLVGWLRGRRVWLDCDDYEAGSGHFKRAWQRWGVAFFERLVPHLVRGVTTNTHFMQDKLRIWGVANSRIFYLPNGVDPERFGEPKSERVKQLQEELGLHGKKVVVFIGSISLVSHPVNLLVEAFAEIVRKQPEMVLLLVGGGEDLERVRQQADQLGVGAFIRMVGRVAPMDVVNYYALADVSVDPVYDDDAARGRAPLKLFESWLCGVPFVTADVGERRELVEQPPAGVLTQPGDARALSTAIHSILNNPSMAERLREEGLKRVKLYTWARLAREIKFEERI